MERMTDGFKEWHLEKNEGEEEKEWLKWADKMVLTAMQEEQLNCLSCN